VSCVEQVAKMDVKILFTSVLAFTFSKLSCSIFRESGSSSGGGRGAGILFIQKNKKCVNSSICYSQGERERKVELRCIRTTIYSFFALR
jgi:hypothetical protein